MRQADRFTQPPLHPVALHRSPQCAAHSETDAQTWGRSPRGVAALQIKNRHAGRKMTPSLFIYTLKVGVAQKPGTAGKAGPLTWSINTFVRFSLGSNDTHTIGSIRVSGL